jgi:hypothetical protein
VLSLRPAEKVYIQKLAMDARSGSPATQKRLQLFWRLLPYFRGGYYLEEIMWLENVERQDVHNMVKTYQACLAKALHE